MAEDDDGGIEALFAAADRPGISEELGRIESGSRNLLNRAGRGPHAPGSDASFAISVILSVAAVRRALESGDARCAAYEGILLGQKLRDWEFAAKYAEHIVRYNSIYPPFAQGRNKANERRRSKNLRKHDRWRAEADKVRSLHPGLSKQALARLIKQRLGAVEAVDTISRCI